MNDKEVEANAFASALLMPEEFIRNDLARYKVDYLDYVNDFMIADLAKYYKVTEARMTMRLVELEILKPYHLMP